MPDPLRTEIDFVVHAAGAQDIEAMYGVSRERLRDGEGWVVETAQEALEKREPGIFWAAHQVDLADSQIERLAGLDQLPSTGFTVACFPLRLVGGSGAPARVVAILD